MQRNKNCLLVMGSVLLLAAFASGCKGTGQQAERPVLPSAQYRPVADQLPMSYESAYAVSSAATMNRVPETTGAHQTTCPVTGARLGSMGAPVPVEIDGRTVYVCCAGCVEKLRQNPERYLGINQAATRPGAASYDEYSPRDRSGSSSSSSAGGSSSCGSGGSSRCH